MSPLVLLREIPGGEIEDALSALLPVPPLEEPLGQDLDDKVFSINTETMHYHVIILTYEFPADVQSTVGHIGG